MNAKIKNALLVGMMVLLFSACGPFKSVSVPADAPEPVVVVASSSTNTPEPVTPSESVEDIPTVVVVEEAGADKSNKYIGLTYSSLPEGLTQGFGMVIWGKDDYGLSLVNDDANKMLWLEKVDRYNEDGSAVWEVKDVLDLSNIETGAVLIPDGCSLNGKVDSEILVVAKNGKALLAWRANTVLDRFEVLATGGIACDTDKAYRFE